MKEFFPLHKRPNRDTWDRMVRRPGQEYSDIQSTVESILAQVSEEGDRALLELTKRLDGADLKELTLEVNAGASLNPMLDNGLANAIDLAIGTITRFHQAQLRNTISVETLPGVDCWQKSIPYQRVGLYVPGGTAPLFSSFLMLAIPAKLAGCEEIVVCTPPGRDGTVHPALLFVAQRLGITKLHLLGGAQAIAAMAFGTETVPAVDKIFGPGNRYVTLAKQLVQQAGTAIDMPAGPSELLVIADDSCNPSYVAADLLSQAEHGPDSMVVLLSDSVDVCERVRSEVMRQVERLPRRDIAMKALENSFSVELSDLYECMAFSNLYAPEHLILAVNEPDVLSEKVRNAGSVFLGHLSGESIGDYASGTNHTLPTSGYARGYSGVSLASFQKLVTFQKLSEEGLRRIGPAVEAMASAEGLDAHRNAVSIRLDAIGRKEPPEAGMETGIHRLMRPHLKNFKGYVSARHTFTGKARVYLDANELPYDGAFGATGGAGTTGALGGTRGANPETAGATGGAGATQAASESLAKPELNLNRYPDPHQSELRNAISSQRGLEASYLFLGNGSDEPIDLLMRGFCEPGRDRILVCPPTYGMYSVSARLAGVEVVEVPLLPNTFQLDVEGIRNAIKNDPSIKIIFFCSPNNPTGNLLSANEIEMILNEFEGLSVVDEAYIDFAVPLEKETDFSALQRLSWTSKLDRHPRLVVLQTLSKAYGLAGIRLGMAWANPELIHVLDTIKPPYNLNELTIRQALLAVTDRSLATERTRRIREILEERTALETALKALPIVENIFPSDANFLLIRFKHSNRVMSHLRSEGIIARDRGGDVAGTIRITIGTPEENALLMNSLASLSPATNTTGSNKPITYS